jgi:hypothetical protein
MANLGRFLYRKPIRSVARHVRRRTGTVKQRFSFEKKFLHTKLRLFGGREPIFVYTMGKVGTTTFNRSLRNIFGEHAVIQVHWLTDEVLAKQEKFYLAGAQQYANTDLERRFFPFFVWRGQYVSDLLRRAESNDKPLRVISLTRDPAARDVSAMFENLLYYFDYHVPTEVDAKGADQVKKELEEIFLENFADRRSGIKGVGDPVTWFDEEMKIHLGVNVYESEFDKEAGYSIISSPRADVLVMRLEDLNRCAGQAVEEFFGLDKFELARANVASDKEYGGLYREFVEELKLPKEYLDRVYGSKMANHFYTESELATFRRCWEE